MQLKTIEKSVTNAINNKKHLISFALIGALVTQVNSAAWVYAHYYKTDNSNVDLINSYIFAVSVELFVFITIKYGKIGLAIAGAVFSSLINLIHTGVPADLLSFDYFGACFLDLLIPGLIICYSLLSENKLKTEPKVKSERKSVARKKTKRVVKMTAKEPEIVNVPVYAF